MEITFKERPIYQAPLWVLEHFYYYTVQYGLSVRQFTGEHWRYWERLPKRLRNAQDSPKQLDSIISELEQLAIGSKERHEKRRSQLKEGKWAEKEIVLNAQLLSVLGALPSELVALTFKNLMDVKDLPKSFEIVDLEMRRDVKLTPSFVEPDLLLQGDRYLLMIEVKTKGGSKSSRKYPANQLLNYLNLAAMCRKSNDSTLPNQFAHMILVPTIDSEWLENHSQWVLDTCDKEGRLRVDPDACFTLSKKKQSYDYRVLKHLADQIPIYYRSWKQLYEGFRKAVSDFDDQRNYKHWQKIGAEIRELSARAGKYV